MDESVGAQIKISLSHLDGLIQRGRQLCETLSANPSNASAIAATRAWHEDCGITVNQLSGSSKAHWLARSFSEAFLMRSASGSAVEAALPTEIVQRLIAVLEQGVDSLTGIDHTSGANGQSPAVAQAPPPRRFEFVHNPELRPIVEQAFTDSQRALEQQDYSTAMLTFCGILEAIVTDALEHKGLSALVASGAPAEKISNWSFETRLTVAEKAGLIRGGCARLPAIARAYRDQPDPGSPNGTSISLTERDARLAAQVLRVIMRDLDPGR
ncbi:MAG: hypothetical protein WBV69_12210 [Candidatus Sulfotelmatobacter sp.]